MAHTFMPHLDTFAVHALLGTNHGTPTRTAIWALFMAASDLKTIWGPQPHHHTQITQQPNYMILTPPWPATFHRWARQGSKDLRAAALISTTSPGQ